MNEEAIKILFADSDGAMSEAINSFLAGEIDYEPAGRATNSDECLNMAVIKRPDILIIHSQLGPIPAIEVCELLAQQSRNTSVIMVLAQSLDESLFHRMMEARVAQFLVCPLEKDKTVKAIQAVVERRSSRRRRSDSMIFHASRKIVAIVGARGGAGRTTVAVNLSCALARQNEKVGTGSRVALVDTNMWASDAADFLDLEPRRTLASVLPHGMSMDGELLDSLLVAHTSGVSLLAAAGSPTHEWGCLPRKVVISVLALLRGRFQFTVVDLTDTESDTGRAVLDLCDQLVVVVGVDLPRLQAGRMFLRWLQESNFPGNKMCVVLNDTEAESGDVGTAQAEAIIESPVSVRLPYDGHLVSSSINLGQPFVLSHPNKPVSRAMQDLALMLVPGQPAAPPAGGLFKLLGLGRR